MIPQYAIDKVTYVRRLITPDQRGNKHRRWLVALTAGVWYVKDLLVTFVADSRTTLKVSGQTASLEWHLNNLFDNTERRITIRNNDTDDDPHWFQSEAQPNPFYSFQSESPTPAYNEFQGESILAFGADFEVRGPSSLSGSDDQIIAIVNQFRMGGTSFITAYA